MTWQKYRLCFRLLSPLHIGYRKVGNLMQTRGYVPGRTLWAALTARLTRDLHGRADYQHYVVIGQAVNESFRLGYLYPALPIDAAKDVKSADDLMIHYPWEDRFDYRFLSSYASTALNYDQQAAAEGLLHETEFIRPWARPLPDDNKLLQVYLVGDLYVRNSLDSKLTGWRTALGQLQLGGERGYGWGRLHLKSPPNQGISEEPTVKVEKDTPVLAHVQAKGGEAIVGLVEPLVGWERDNTEKSAKNWRLSPTTICYTPGAVVKKKTTFTIGHYGIWL